MTDYIIDKIEYNSNVYKLQDNISGYTSNIGKVTEVDLNGTPIATSGSAQLAIAQLSDIIYPVGCYYETSDSSFNPQTAWGGTWELEDAGLVHIGAKSDVETNLLDNPTADAGQSHMTYNVADFNFNTSLIAGNIYTVTAKINTSSEKKCIGFYHSGGSYYMAVPNTLAWLPISSNGIYSVVFIATDEMAAQTSGSGHGFCRVYASNNTNTGQGSTTVTGTANVDWIIVEEGCRLGAIGGNTTTRYTPNYTVADHQLTINEMPSHTHTASKQGYSFTLGSYQTSTSSTGGLAGVITASTGVTGAQATGISSIFPRTSQAAGMSYLTINSAHTHASYGKDGGHNHDFIGNSTSVSTMQPYIVVNRWHKIGPAARKK